MSSLKRVVSDSDSESESDSAEEETKKNANRKYPEQQQEPVKVSDGESESESDVEEGTRKLQRKPSKQQEVEDESESESESLQEPTHEPVPQPRTGSAKKETKAKGPVKVPLVTHTISSKRGRDANGANGVKGGTPVEVPSSKRMKQSAVKDDKAEKSPLRKERRMEQAARGSTKATGAGAAKSEKGTGRKRKAPTPPPAAVSGRQQVQKVEGEKSLTKPKKPFSWSSAVEESLVKQLHEDYLKGFVIPVTKVDPYWDRILKLLPLEEDLKGLQLSDKVRRMKQRYYTLKDRSKDDGAKLFKSPHEEKMYQLWTDIWDSGAKVSEPAAEVEHSEDESAETAAGTAALESSKLALKQSNGEVSKDVATQNNCDGSRLAETQAKVGDSISDDENEEEVALAQQATSKVPSEPVVSPFVSKPRLEFTPVVSKEAKSQAPRKAISIDQHREEVPATDDEGKVDVVPSGDQHLRQLREAMIWFVQELRSSLFPGIDERNGSSMGGLGNVLQTGSAFVSGVLEGLGAGSGSPAARELRKKWLELKLQEIALLSQRLQLMQEHCRLQQEELKLQMQRLDE
ncbi:unnamed protein product [Calypogeia fissa]